LADWQPLPVSTARRSAAGPHADAAVVTIPLKLTSSRMPYV